MSEIAEVELLDWLGRLKLVDSICNLVLISPKVGQVIAACIGICYARLRKLNEYNEL